MVWYGGESWQGTVRPKSVLGTGVSWYTIAIQTEGGGNVVIRPCRKCGLEAFLIGVNRGWISLLWQPILPLKKLVACYRPSCSCNGSNNLWETVSGSASEELIWKKVDSGFTSHFNPFISLTKSKSKVTVQPAKTGAAAERVRS
jgi:hypothetical protein